MQLHSGRTTAHHHHHHHRHRRYHNYDDDDDDNDNDDPVRYTAQLMSRPLLTKSTTLFFISALSDVNAQTIANRGKAAAGLSDPREWFDETVHT